MSDDDGLQPREEDQSSGSEFYEGKDGNEFDLDVKSDSSGDEEEEEEKDGEKEVEQVGTEEPDNGWYSEDSDTERQKKGDNEK
eukprot:TRINITY_DN1034_c0_g1_i1.p2 TRINITY_DN1034_c0_g1~~TRINITY_DN1034_c0_g1_i1.p2  ORF type:complete len:83 (+),score=29.25 TRINITY_DN1034_c0_g1_i1:97-345(+)